METIKKHTTKLPKDIPEAMEVMTAISILEKYYPKLNITNI